jgi:hypothetical protein
MYYNGRGVAQHIVAAKLGRVIFGDVIENDHGVSL